MKKILSLISVALLLCAALAVSCKKLANGPESGDGGAGEETATLTVSLSGVDTDISTRTSSTAENNGDKTASDVQFLILDSSGNYVKGFDAAGTVKLSKGMIYTVVAVVNGPAVYGAKRSDLQAVQCDLAAYPYVMYGEATANLSSASSATVTVSVTSLAARVHLTSVKNSLPGAFGAITLKRAYLCNAKGYVKLDGSAVSTWYNQYGRKALGTPVTANSLTGAVDSENTASAYTFKSYESSPATIAAGSSLNANVFYYAFPNPLKTAIPANLATTTTWTDQATWLTVCGEVNGTIYYWTANLGAALANGIERNCSYDVALTINNLGSSDPGTPVTEATATLGISIQPWQAGSATNLPL